MSTDTLSSKWQDLTGKIKDQWNKFSDAELKDIGGNANDFLTALQKKYGYAEEQAKQHLDKFMKQNNLSEDMDWSRMKEGAVRVVQNFPQEFGQFIQSNPCKAVLVALGTGFLLGSFVMR